jgi:TonB family protein
MLPGNTPPRHPSPNSVTNPIGNVIIGFVIDENGRPMPNTFSVVRTSENAYALEALEALRGYRFQPAEIAGRPVRMWVLLPFEFLRAAGAAPGAAAGTELPVPPPSRGTGAAAPGRQQAYYQFEVERVARMLPGNPPPAYPSELRRAGMRGRVIVSFVIDTTGKADMSTFRVLESNHDLFSAEVIRILPSFNFAPAQIGSRKVRMWVSVPFEWAMMPGAI